MAALITTVIPTYRRPDLLKRAIGSVLHQSFSDVAIHVYDNASGDGTGEDVRQIMTESGHVHYECHKRNLGAVANFNHGLSQITTPFFSVLADDDMLLPDFYATGIRVLEEQPDVGFFIGRCMVYNAADGSIYPSDAQWRDGEAGRYEPGIGSVVKMIARPYSWTGILWRREVLDYVPGLDAFGSDDNFVCKLASKFPFVVSNSSTALSYHHSARFSIDPHVDSRHDRRLEHGAYLDYLVGRSFQLQADIVRLEGIPRDLKLVMTNAVNNRLRREMRSWFFTHAVPNRRPAEMATALQILETVGGDAHIKWTLRSLQRLFADAPPLEALTAAVTRSTRSLLIKRRSVRSKRDPIGTDIRAWVKQTTAPYKLIRTSARSSGPTT